MSATVERMLERKYRLDKEKSRSVASVAKTNLGFGKNVLYCKRLLDECLRVAEDKGYIKDGKPLPLTRRFSFNTLPSRNSLPGSSHHDKLSSQSSHVKLSSQLNQGSLRIEDDNATSSLFNSSVKRPQQESPESSLSRGESTNDPVEEDHLLTSKQMLRRNEPSLCPLPGNENPATDDPRSETTQDDSVPKQVSPKLDQRIKSEKKALASGLSTRDQPLPVSSLAIVPSSVKQPTLDERQVENEKPKQPIRLFDGLVLDGPLPIVSDNAKLPSQHLLRSFGRRKYHSDEQIVLNSTKESASKGKKSRSPRKGSSPSIFSSCRWESIPKPQNSIPRSHSDHGHSSSRQEALPRFYSDHGQDSKSGSRWISDLGQQNRRSSSSSPSYVRSVDQPVSPPSRTHSSLSRSRFAPNKPKSSSQRDNNSRGMDQPVALPSRKYCSVVPPPEAPSSHSEGHPKLPNRAESKSARGYGFGDCPISKPIRASSMPLLKPTRRGSINSELSYEK